MKKIGYFLVVLCLFGLVGCSSDAQSSQPAYAGAGENGVTKDQTLFAYSKSDFDELMKYVSAHNNEAAHQMQDEGKILVLDPKTKVTVVNVSMDATDLIEIKSGPYQGKRGYVPNDFILKAK